MGPPAHFGVHYREYHGVLLILFFKILSIFFLLCRAFYDKCTFPLHYERQHFPSRQTRVKTCSMAKSTGEFPSEQRFLPWLCNLGRTGAEPTFTPTTIRTTYASSLFPVHFIAETVLSVLGFFCPFSKEVRCLTWLLFCFLNPHNSPLRQVSLRPFDWLKISQLATWQIRAFGSRSPWVLVNY